MQKVFAEDDHSLPRHVPSGRPGGEARREILKSRAADIPWSVSEVFAYAQQNIAPTIPYTVSLR